MYLCKITKREVSRNSNCRDTTVHELVSSSSSILAGNAKKWIKKHFLPAYKGSVMTTFITVDGFTSLNVYTDDSKPHNIYNGRATMFDEYGNPVYIIAIDVYSVEVVN